MLMPLIMELEENVCSDHRWFSVLQTGSEANIINLSVLLLLIWEDLIFPDNQTNVEMNMNIKRSKNKKNKKRCSFPFKEKCPAVSIRVQIIFQMSDSPSCCCCQKANEKGSEPTTTLSKAAAVLKYLQVENFVNK